MIWSVLLGPVPFRPGRGRQSFGSPCTCKWGHTEKPMRHNFFDKFMKIFRISLKFQSTQPRNFILIKNVARSPEHLQYQYWPENVQTEDRGKKMDETIPQSSKVELGYFNKINSFIYFDEMKMRQFKWHLLNSRLPF